MILAAGRSTRLGRLGARLPKPMLPLGGRPLLAWTLERLRAAGLSEVVINLHHALAAIPAHFGDGAAWGLQITYLIEDELLGTAGGVRNARHLLQAETFLVVYGDTVLDWDPAPALREHRRHRPLATIVVAEVDDPSALGVVRFDADGRITAFVEKPGPRPELGRWVNAGLYILEPSIFDHLPARGPSDFGADVFPALLQRALPLRAYPRPRPLLVIDTPRRYRAARRAWDRRARGPEGAGLADGPGR